MMKVNRFEMLIKFAALCVCMNIVLSVPLSSNEQNSNNDKKSVTTASKHDDYDDNASIEKTSENTNAQDTKPPLVFPEPDEAKNETALEILQNSNTSVASDLEQKENSTSKQEVVVDDKKTINENKDNEAEGGKSDDDKIKAQTDKQEKDYDDVSPKNETNDDSKEKDYDAENLQEPKDDQGNVEEQYGVNSTTINIFEEPTLNGSHIAFIFASTLIVLSIVAYFGLIMWRKNLEQRYGMRQRLVTEDDYYNNNDVRFFGL